MAKYMAGFFKDVRGATAIEYGLIAALISVALITGLTHYYDAMTALFENLGTTLTSAFS